ncbi:uncharacterized protein LOC62_05G006728 [Vanrija pseudolonga]|uniref:Uncharacterized protein n=1 Tax=Vanrija pseudolonga TaxID=143232 RepID=A0AAF1BM99_9TREE|nr:hypothetical protein LOC62_05G006728 [Vanrija pseudolonga]
MASAPFPHRRYLDRTLPALRPALDEHVEEYVLGGIDHNLRTKEEREEGLEALIPEIKATKDSQIDASLRTERQTISKRQMEQRFEWAGIVDASSTGTPLRELQSNHALCHGKEDEDSDVNEEPAYKRRMKAEFTPNEDDFAVRLIAALGPHDTKLQGARATKTTWAPWQLESWERIMASNTLMGPLLENYTASSWAKRYERGGETWASLVDSCVQEGINTRLQTEAEAADGTDMGKKFGATSLAVVKPLAKSGTVAPSNQRAWSSPEIDLFCRIIAANRRLSQIGLGPKTRCSGQDRKTPTPDKDSFWANARAEHGSRHRLWSWSDWQLREYYHKHRVPIEDNVEEYIKAGIQANLKTRYEPVNLKGDWHAGSRTLDI